MTSIGDVIRQVETALDDPNYPPTLDERILLTSILYRISSSSFDNGRTR